MTPYGPRRIISWALMVLTLLFLLSGFGITRNSIVEPLTLGLLGKATSSLLHSFLWGPFLILLILHISLSCRALKR